MGYTVPIPEGSPFTFNNIPFGVISPEDLSTEDRRCATAIGDYAVDLSQYFADLHNHPVEPAPPLSPEKLWKIFAQVNHSE